MGNHLCDGYPCLIICPKNALYVWQLEIEHWLKASSTVYTGKPKQRKELWKEYMQGNKKFLITNYAMMQEVFEQSAECKHLWKGFIADEIHMGGLLNHKSKASKTVDKYTRHIEHKFLLTGTPIRQGVVDLYEPLHIIDPQRFTAYWPFVNRYCVVTAGPFGKEIGRNPRHVEMFREMLQTYMIRRVKQEVFKELPTKIRQAIPVVMNDEQQRVYKDLTKDLIALIGNPEDENLNILSVPGVLPLMMRQRQILSCPQALGLTTPGTAIEEIVSRADDLFFQKQPFIVFSPFREALHWAEVNLEKTYGKTFNKYYIQGKMSAEEFRDSWMGFENDNSGRSVMFCIIKSGASFKATKASTAFFLGCEWDFNLNVQAEDRMFSPDKESGDMCYYLLHKDTIEDSIIAKLNEKNFSSDWIVGTDKQFKETLKRLYRK